MSIQGSLEDVGVADVLQFVHLGGSTGTLVLGRGDERVEIGFHEGGIINAWDSQSLRLGELLVARGLVSTQVVECALALQATRPEPVPSIGDLLVDEGFVDPESLRAAAVEQIRQSILRVVEWTQGSFEFVKGPPRRRDAFDRDSVLGYKLNTQALLLDIALILDNARSGLTAGPEPRIQAPTPRPSRPSQPEPEAEVEVSPAAAAPTAALPALEPKPAPTSEGGGAESEAEDRAQSPVAAEELLDPRPVSRPLVWVVSDDAQFSRQLSGLDCDVEILSFRDAWQLGRQPTSIVVVDLRRNPLADLAAVTADAGGVAPVVLLPDITLSASAYALGARAVIPDQPPALAMYVGAMIAAERTPAADAPRADADESHGFARLREIFADLRDSAPSATRILSLMRVVSDFAQRAAVFMLLGNQLRVIGAFGRSANGAPLADVLRRAGAFALEGALAEAARRRKLVTKTGVTTEAALQNLLPACLAAALGPAANGRFQIVPVAGGDKVVLLVYLDNDERLQPVAGLDVIELAGAHVGLIFENELLKRLNRREGREWREPSLSSG